MYTIVHRISMANGSSSLAVPSSMSGVQSGASDVVKNPSATGFPAHPGGPFSYSREKSTSSFLCKMAHLVIYPLVN